VKKRKREIRVDSAKRERDRERGERGTQRESERERDPHFPLRGRVSATSDYLEK
jgi:hypothetical protein